MYVDVAVVVVVAVDHKHTQLCAGYFCRVGIQISSSIVAFVSPASFAPFRFQTTLIFHICVSMHSLSLSLSLSLTLSLFLFHPL